MLLLSVAGGATMVFGSKGFNVPESPGQMTYILPSQAVSTIAALAEHFASEITTIVLLRNFWLDKFVAESQ